MKHIKRHIKTSEPYVWMLLQMVMIDLGINLTIYTVQLHMMWGTALMVLFMIYYTYIWVESVRRIVRIHRKKAKNHE